MLKHAACISNGTVVNVAVYDDDTSGPWLKAVKKNYDEVRIVDQAGIGWTVEGDELRPPSPYASWTWDGSEWVAPVPQPEGPHIWDEEAGAWQPVIV